MARPKLAVHFPMDVHHIGPEIPARGSNMQQHLRKSRKAKLARAMAQGESITDWARQHGVSERTAFRWASDPEVRRSVEAWRRQALNRALGKLASLSMQAAEGIARLGESADSESVQLRAHRAVLTDQMAISRFSDLEQRMMQIEEKLRGRTGQKSQSS
jgi:hypothetical protein